MFARQGDITVSNITMERNNDEAKIDADSGSGLISENSLVPESGKSTVPVEKKDNALVAFCHESEDPNISIITVWGLMKLVYPIFNHVFDFVSDIRLANDYFENQKTVDGSLTLALTALQAIASTWISFLMHHPRLGKVSAGEEDEKTEKSWLKKTAKLIFYGIFIIFQRALPSCHLRKLYYACRVRMCQQKQNKVLLNRYHRKMLAEVRDLAVLGVVECFLQTAPQLILQLYILLAQDTAISAPMWWKIASGSMTLFTLGKSIKNYHCACRSAQEDKAVIGKTGRAFILFWHLGTITGRILVIGIAASSWLLYTALACVINWMGWTAWIYVKENVISMLRGNKTESPSTSQTTAGKIRNLLLAGVVGSVYMFTFVNLREGPTFTRNTVYYILCLLQNGTVVVLWFLFTNLTIENVCFSKDLLIVSVILYLIGIAAMITYYKCFHPTLRYGVYKLEFVTCV